MHLWVKLYCFIAWLLLVAWLLLMLSIIGMPLRFLSDQLISCVMCWSGCAREQTKTGLSYLSNH